MKYNRFEIFPTSVLQVAKSVQTIKSRKIAEYDLKGTNAMCLCEIMDSGERGLSATELSRRCDIDKAQVSRCMKELMDREMVYRNDMEGRRYKQKYHLTEAGLAAARDIDAVSANLHETVKKGLTTEELELFYRIANTMCRNFEESGLQAE